MWTSTGDDRGTTIHHVRLRGTGGLDPLAARLRAARAIDHAAGDVALPASAILCVRQLRDPRPRQVTLSAVQPPRAEWSRAVGDALVDLARAAARPAAGPVDPNIDAVLFDDRAQLLACLAADWCRGSLTSCWWWAALIGSGAEAEALLRAWRRNPEHIAGAIEALAASGQVTAFVRRLSEADASTLLEAIVRAHGLSARLIAADIIGPLKGLAEVENSFPRPPLRIESRGAVDANTVWRKAAEARAAGLHIEQRLLVGIALTLRRDPVRARSSAFVEEVTEWRKQITMARPERQAPHSYLAPTANEATGNDALTTTAATVVARDTASPSSERSPSPDDDAHVAPPRPIGPEPHRSSAAASTDVASPEPTAHAPVLTRTATPVETELGGVFYLLNVALALGLYGDFTQPLAPRLDVSIWRFIALVGRRLLRGRHHDDRLWELLSDLAGPDEAQIRPIDEWRLEPAWLAAFPECRTWRWHATDERLLVQHPAGFTILDIGRTYEQSTSEQLRAALAPYQAAPLLRQRRTSATGPAHETGHDRWLRWHTEYIRARLARALGVSAARSGDLLCRHHARVHCSLTHVNVAFSLGNLPIVIRLSGLDRDPGWIPSADRIVSFHYD